MKIIHSTFSNPSPIKLKINLEDMPLSVFRRVMVPEDANMMQLHFIIQLAMGWQFAHLFQFSDKRHNANIHITIPDEDYNDFYRVETRKADEIGLKAEFQFKRGGKPFWYWYDFGDSWYHKITFQKPTKKDLELFTGSPVCVDAFGACPPEDVGGPWGYSDFLTAVTNKKHPGHQEWREWAGIPLRGKFEPEYVNLEEINRALKSYHNSSEWGITADKYFEE